MNSLLPKALRWTLILALSALPAARAEPAAAPLETAAIVVEVSGRVTADTAGTPRRLLERLSRLRAGETVRIEDGASLKLVFANGLRYRLGPGSSVTLGSQGLASSEGEVQALAPVPTLPRVPAIRDDRGSQSAATRVRGETLAGLYPKGTTVLADRVRLLFEAVPNTPAYTVEIADPAGERVFRAEVKNGPVEVPAGTLVAGVRYSFRIETSGRPGPEAVGRGSFVTLSDEVAREHLALEEALKKEGDAGAWALLASVNRDLGLLLEAKEASQAALALAPGDAGLLATLAGIERQLRSS